MRDPAGAAERARVYVRAAEYFEKALLLDPSCAFAAQGLAIGISEGTIGTGIPVVPGVPVEEHAVRSKNSRDALTILTKLKDAINSGSVYVNIGHCHFVREEWEKAIESVSPRLSVSHHPSNETDLGMGIVRNGVEAILWREGCPDTALPRAIVVPQSGQGQELLRLAICSPGCSSRTSQPVLAVTSTDSLPLFRLAPSSLTTLVSSSTLPSSNRLPPSSSSTSNLTVEPSHSSRSLSSTSRSPPSTSLPLLSF